jgi:hypothetical protein
MTYGLFSLQLSPQLKAYLIAMSHIGSTLTLNGLACIENVRGMVGKPLSLIMDVQMYLPGIEPVVATMTFYNSENIKFHDKLNFAI